jgi:isoquinoline 1-oxidoreductase beta subunit
MNMPSERPADTLLASIAGRKIGRRGFLTFAAKGLALAFALPLAGRIAEAEAAEAMQKVNAFIRVGTGGTVELAFGGCEMGQGTMTGLAQILAEELMVEWDQIAVRQALVETGVSYNTGGSSGVARRYTSLRKAGAAARELLIAAAMLNRRLRKLRCREAGHLQRHHDLGLRRPAAQRGCASGLRSGLSGGSEPR